MKISDVDLLNGPIDSSLRKFAAPLAFSFLIHMLYAWVDLYFVSLLGDSPMAAMGISERIWFFTFAIGSGFAIGSSVIVSRRIGEGNRIAANHTATQSIIFMLFFAIIIAIGLYFLLPLILDVLQIEGKVAEQAGIYFSALILGVPFNFIVFQVNAIIRSTGNSFYPMVLLIFSNIINAIFTPILIFGLGPIKPMGLYGAGLGTAVAQFAGAIFCVWLLTTSKTTILLQFKGLKLDLSIVKSIFRLGIPASLQLVAISLASMGLAANANLFGVKILTTYILGLRVDLLISMSIFAVGAAMEIISGQNMGAKKYERIFAYHRSAMKQLGILMFVLGTIAFFAGDQVALIFTDDPVIKKEVGNYLKIVAYSYIPLSIGIISIRTISGAGDYTRSLAIVASIILGLQLLLAYGLSTVLNHQRGIWIAMLITTIVFALVGFKQLHAKKWLKAKV